jgi:hypothetical protein
VLENTSECIELDDTNHIWNYLQLSFDLLESWLLAHPKASICAEEGVSRFKEIALYQDYHGLPACRKVQNCNYLTNFACSSPTLNFLSCSSN